jgi:hypothetical protein
MNPELEPKLDGQVYQPSPYDIPDNREGFDINGDYHRICPDVSGLDKSPYAKGLRLAKEQQTGYDSEGNYHNPELRIEHTRLERIDISDDDYNHLLEVYAEVADNLERYLNG